MKKNTILAEFDEAIWTGNISEIECLVKLGIDVNTFTYKGVTPLFIAAQEGYVDAIVKLVELGAKINTPTNDGATPLYIAAKIGHIDAIVKLKELGANVNTPMNNGITPVYIAAKIGHIDATAKLIGFGANLEFLNQNLENISSLVIKQFIKTENIISKYKNDNSLARLENQEILTLVEGAYALQDNSIIALNKFIRQGKVDIANYNNSAEGNRTTIGESLYETMTEQLKNIPGYNQNEIEKKKDNDYSIEIKNNYLIHCLKKDKKYIPKFKAIAIGGEPKNMGKFSSVKFDESEEIKSLENINYATALRIAWILRIVILRKLTIVLTIVNV